MMHLEAWCPQGQQQEPAHAVPALQDQRVQMLGHVPHQWLRWSMEVVAQPIIRASRACREHASHLICIIPVLEIPYSKWN